MLQNNIERNEIHKDLRMNVICDYDGKKSWLKKVYSRWMSFWNKAYYPIYNEWNNRKWRPDVLAQCLLTTNLREKR